MRDDGEHGLEFARLLVERALAVGADEAQAENVIGRRFELDADTRSVKLLRSTIGDDTTITLFRDGKKGSAGLNGRDEAAIAAAVAAALSAADAGLVDEAHQLAAGPGAAPTRHGPDVADREAMLDAVTEYLVMVAETYPTVLTRHAIYAFDETERSFVNSNGLTQQERRAGYEFSTMFGAKDGLRSTSFSHTRVFAYRPFARLMEAGGVRRLLDNTVRSFDTRPVAEKFVGDLVITPECVGTVVSSIAEAMGGYALMAETTPYRTSKDEWVAAPGFSLLNQPRHVDFPNGADFDGFGVPTRDLDIIHNGVLKEFLVDFYCAKKLNMEQTAGRYNFVVPPGDRDIDDIVKSTSRGILLGRLSGGAPNHKLDFNGVAKNSFYIEDGGLRHPLSETMLAGNFKDLLMNIRAVSRETVNFGTARYPYLAASGVTISGK